jgi:fucose permease
MAIPGGVLNVAWTYMQVTFSVPLDSLGVLLFAATCGGLLGTFFSGRLIGRFGMGRYLTAGGALMALGLVGYAVAPVWLTLIVSAFVTTLGFSIFNAGLNMFVAANYSTGQLNWMHAAYGVGGTFGPALAHWRP